jgi:hypothetical protein
MAARQPQSTAHATKRDVHALGADLRRVDSKLNDVESKLNDVEAKLTADIQAVRIELGAEIGNVASKVVAMGERLVILERIESSVRFVAENMVGKASATAMTEADDPLGARVSLLEDVTRQHAVDIRQLRSR